MDFKSDPAGLAARILAIISLVMGLGDAAALLGLGAGAQSPITAMGATGFIFLAALCIARLFAAVGLWIRVQWGAVILLGSLIVEIALYLSGTGWVRLSLWGFIFKLATLLATFGLLGLNRILLARHVAD